jgi:hypothetical protein
MHFNCKDEVERKFIGKTCENFFKKNIYMLIMCYLKKQKKKKLSYQPSKKAGEKSNAMSYFFLDKVSTGVQLVQG